MSDLISNRCDTLLEHQEVKFRIWPHFSSERTPTTPYKMQPRHVIDIAARYTLCSVGLEKS